MKLNIGVINYKLPGPDGVPYIHIDAHNHMLWKEGVGAVPLDLVADCRKLPYEHGTIEEVYSSELLEHLGRWEYMGALKEWYRVLCVGGRVIIEVPNLLGICVQFVEHPEDRRGLMQLFYGGQDRGLEHFDYHCNGFTPEILKEDLESIGFKVTDSRFEKGLIHVEATK